MGKFIFRLQPLLNVKKQFEENLKNELGKAMQALEKEKQKLVLIENDKKRCIDEFNDHTSRGVRVEKLREYNIYISLLNDRIVIQKEAIKKAKQNADGIRDQLVEIMKEREMLEKLREKKFQHYLKEQLSEEQKVLDEIASYKHNKSLTGD